MKIPNEFYPSFEDSDYELLYSPSKGSMNHSGKLMIFRFFNDSRTGMSELFPVRLSRIPALRYKADESIVDLIVPIATELVECPPWLRMAGGGTAHRMYQIIYKRVFERPFFQMYKLAIANKRFDILGQFSDYQILLYRCLEACFRLARRLLLVMGCHFL